MQHASVSASSIGFVVKRAHPGAHRLALELAQFSHNEGKKVFFSDEAPKFKEELDFVRLVPKADLHLSCDLIVVLGGDGTFLSVARLMKQRTVPILGVNMGTLGFITETPAHEAKKMLKKIFAGESVQIRTRSMLEAQLCRGDVCLASTPVVNDVVVAKGAIARIFGMRIKLNGQLINHIRADGLIIASPTGSTAYNLAAGGPILEPELGAMVLAPICPHSLTQRPLVISDQNVLTIEIQENAGAVFLTLDGQEVHELQALDRVIIKRFQSHPLTLITDPSRNYFQVLREKLNFGNSEVVPL